MQNDFEILKEENENLKNRLNQVEQTMNIYKEMFQEIIKEVQALGDVVSNTHTINVREHYALHTVMNNLPFEIEAPIKELSEFYYPNIVDANETIEEIVRDKKSIARFGDGEFETIFGNVRHGFQHVDENLGLRLKEVLQSDMPELLIGIADNYGRLDKYTDLAKDGIRSYMQPEVRRKHLQVLSKDKVYYDAYMSRPYVIYRDNVTQAPKQRFLHLQKIWEARDVIMIEGEQTRLGIGNDLFSNCKSIRRILAPAVSSFDRYDDILNEALKIAKKNDLFLIATGPSAGVFAYDLTKAGYQAVDVGHVDVEYEWMKQGTGQRGPIASKYTNEIPGDEVAIQINDPVYESQIVARYV